MTPPKEIKRFAKGWSIPILAVILSLFPASGIIAGDIAITGSNVLASRPSQGGQTANGIAGDVITPGQALYSGTETPTALLHKANATISGSFGVAGISLNGASIGQPVTYVRLDGNFRTGGSHTRGDIICLSGSNAGGICKAADMASGMWVTVLGVATSGTTINLNPTTTSGTIP